MAAKRIRISADDGTTWFTFPGDKGEIHDEADGIKDTILGQEFSSEQTGMIQWNVTTNGLYKGFAGYVAKIMKSGTATTMTADPMSLVSGKIYRITASTKSVFDRATAITVLDNAVAVDAEDIESIDYLHGRVIFDAGYTVTGPVTITGKYLPMTQIAKANSFTLTQTAGTKDTSVFESAQANGGYRTFEYGLRTVSLGLKGIYASSNAFRALLAARSELVIEINPDGSSKSVARGFFKAMSTGQTGNVGELEEQDLNFTLSVPDDEDITLPFDWQFASDSTLSQAVRITIDAWEAGEVVKVAYLEDGTTGTMGDAVITDLTLSGGLDVMNDFSIKFQGTDAPEAYA